MKCLKLIPHVGVMVIHSDQSLGQGAPFSQEVISSTISLFEAFLKI